MKRILALLMSVSITASSFSCATAIPVYADTVAGNFVSMSVMVSLLLSAYGIQRTIEGSQYINELIQQCTQEATQSGFGMLKNGIQSIGVTIQNGVSYVQKAFAEWVYNWALENNIFDVSQEQVPEYFTFEEGTYTISGGISFNDLVGIANIPSDVVQALSTSSYINVSNPCYIDISDQNSGVQYNVFTVPIGTRITFNSDQESTSPITGARSSKNKTTGAVSGPYRTTTLVKNTGDHPVGSVNHTVINGLNGTLTGASDLDYGVTSDIPDISQDLDSYASDWVADGITSDDEDYIPITLPIDSAGTAVGVVEGTTEAINDAGVIGQYDVRDGTISADAIEDLQQAVSDSEAEEELNDDFTIQGLEGVFPFCLPWDFAHFISLLRADPVAPNFELQALNADGETISYTFDLSMFDSVALVCRNMELLAFIIALILITKGFFV